MHNANMHTQYKPDITAYSIISVLISLIILHNAIYARYYCILHMQYNINFKDFWTLWIFNICMIWLHMQYSFDWFLHNTNMNMQLNANMHMQFINLTILHNINMHMQDIITYCICNLLIWLIFAQCKIVCMCNICKNLIYFCTMWICICKIVHTVHAVY